MKISTSTQNKKGSVLKKSIIIIFLIIIWEMASRTINAEVYFPSFLSTLNALFNLMKTEIFYISVFTSLYRVTLGFVLAMSLGLILALVCSLNSFVEETISFLMIIVKSTPVASFIILSLIWFESSSVPIFICFLMLLPIMFENVVNGIKSIDVKLLEVIKVYKISKKDYFIKVLIPSLKPFINAALVASFGLGWKAAISAEVLSRPKIAIGSSLYDAKIYLETPSLFAWTLTVIILSYTFEQIIKKLSLKTNGGVK